MNRIFQHFIRNFKNLIEFNNFRKEVIAIKLRKKLNAIAIIDAKHNLSFNNTISFASNNYLGMTENKKVVLAGVEALKKFGAGAGASKFIEGYSAIYEEIKKEVISLKNCEDCTIFTSGYTANLGIFGALAMPEDIIFLDEFSHASSFQGVLLSGAKIMRFKHNNLEDLEQKLEKFGKNLKGKVFIATETVFSMKGTVLLEPESYITLAKKYNAILVVDEAHSFGLLDFKFPKYELHITIGTFSKAVGVLGGYVYGNSILIEAIRQFAKSGIYTTALPPSVLASVFASLKLISSGEVNGKKALQNAQFFSKLTGIKAESQIIFIECKNNEEALKLEQALLEKGFFVKAIRPPTVPTAGIRLSFNNLHKKVDIKKLAYIIKYQITN